VLNLALFENGVFADYFADPAVGDVFGLHVLLFPLCLENYQSR
jgi:hypothetical protein